MGLPAKIKRLVNTEFIRFLIAGGVNTAFGYIVFAVSFFLTKHEAVALILDYGIGAFFNFQSYSRLAFSGYKGGRFVFFCLVYVVVYFVNYFILLLFIRHFELNAYASQLFALVVCPLLLYVLLKKFVFIKDAD
jgi:putative flippase GtrA